MTNARETTRFVTDKAIALIRALHNPPIGAKEFSGGWCSERCDAILFDSGSSYLIETKISRGDFLADFKKAHRQEGCGIGNYRYYACPTGLIKPEELPEKWGLIYVDLIKKSARAAMPVGHGGVIRNPRKDTKDPKHGWTIQGYDVFGTLLDNGHGTMVPAYRIDRGAHRFPDSFLDRHYLFALATRYKNKSFMGNIL